MKRRGVGEVPPAGRKSRHGAGKGQKTAFQRDGETILCRWPWAVLELCIDDKLKEWNRLCATDGALAYLVQRFGALRVLAKLRARAKGRWCAGGMREELKYVRKVHEGEIEEMAFQVKLLEAKRLAGNYENVWVRFDGGQRAFLRALRDCGQYGVRRQLMKEIRRMV